MLFREISDKELPDAEKPIIILLHGGGLSSWSLQGVAEQMQADYQVIIPLIDGHGGDGEFIDIRDSADKLIAYIDTNCDGKVFALGGLSIGAQIVTEILSLRADIAEYAVIESALVYPIRGLAAAVYGLFYGLSKKRWFSKLQAGALCIPAEMFKRYYQDSLKISRHSLINMTASNGSYHLQPSIADTRARVLIIVGEKEIGVMHKFARRLHEQINDSVLYIAPAMKHGELSLRYPDQYVGLLREFFQNDVIR